MDTTLVIMAAGIGSRFGGGVKQLMPVGPNGEIIIDYSIHDAIKAGFNKILFVIRKDIDKDFREAIGDRIEKICENNGVKIGYAYQDIHNIPGEFPEGRTKPWGTGQAVLACEGQLDGPFAVINADDYYGSEGFKKAAAFLKNDAYGMVAYILKNTLSDNGGVTRGICSVEDGKLTGIDETHNIVKTADGAEADGKKLDPESLVSMNFLCFPGSFMEVLKESFPVFLQNMKNPLKDEFLLPVILDGLIQKGTEVAVLPTDDKWFGMTYKEDRDAVAEAFEKMYEEGKYNKDNLYGDLK